MPRVLNYKCLCTSLFQLGERASELHGLCGRSTKSATDPRETPAGRRKFTVSEHSHKSAANLSRASVCGVVGSRGALFLTVLTDAMRFVSGCYPAVRQA